MSVYPAVLSIGYNPFYRNATRSIEIHILHHFPSFNFYHAALNLLVLGFVRPEYDYASLEALVDDIRADCHVARRSLARPAYETHAAAAWLRDFGWWREEDVRRLEEETVGRGEGGGGEADKADGAADGKL